MKKKSTSKSAFFNLRVLIASVFCLIGVFVALVGSGAFAQTKNANNSRSAQASPGTQTPDVVQMVGPVRLDQDLRNLPYVAPKEEFEEQRLRRYPFPLAGSDASAGSGISGLKYTSRDSSKIFRARPRRCPGHCSHSRGISTPAVVSRVTARGMSALIITLKRSTKPSRSLTKAVILCRARPVIIHSFRV